MKRQLIKTGITVTLPIVILIGYFQPARFHPNEPDAKRNDGSKHSR